MDVYADGFSISGTGCCYDNARMERFFVMLKKEKSYQIQTGKMMMAQAKSLLFRYIMTYCNRERIHTGNPDGFAPVLYRQAASGLAASES